MNGSLAEWLGTGLQNRLRRFESARNLKKNSEVVYLQHFRSFLFLGGTARGTDYFFNDNISPRIKYVLKNKLFASWESISL